MVALAHNGWGLTKFCLLPNLKNMKKPKGKILFKPLLGAVCFHKCSFGGLNLFFLKLFLGGFYFFSLIISKLQ